MNDLNRFIEAQKFDYELALKEIKNGHKVNHWMWYIFPQIKGLGQSDTAYYYGINDLDEAKEYLENDILGKRLKEISQELLKLECNDATIIFGSIDSLKLKSCMTLFSLVSEDCIFQQVLDKFYNGYQDEMTLILCNRD